MDTHTLTIKLAGDIADLQAKMRMAEQLVGGATDKIKSSFGGMLATLGAGISIAGLAAFVKTAINSADALDEMSGRVGVSAKELSSLQLAFRQAGMSNEDMGGSLAKLSKQMADGNKMFDAMGVKVKNTDGTLRGTTSVLSDVADQFAGMQDGAGKTALAIELFGKSGSAMVPLLNEGSQGIREMTEMATKLGLVIEDSTAAQAGKFNDTLELLQLGVTGVGQGIAAQLLPTLNGLAGEFLTTMTNGDKLKNTADFLSSAFRILYIGGVGIVEVFSSVGKIVGGTAAAIMAALSGNFSEAKSIMSDLAGDVKTGWTTAAASMKAAWETQGNAAVDAAAKGIGANRNLIAEQKKREESEKAGASASTAAVKAQEAFINGLQKESDKILLTTTQAKLKEAALLGITGKTLEHVKAILEQDDAYKKSIKSAQERADLRKKESDAIDAWKAAQTEAYAAAVKGSKDALKAAQDEYDQFGMSKSQIAEITLLTLQSTQAKFNDGSEGYIAIQKQIDAQRELIEVLRKTEGMEVAKKVNEEKVADWKKSVDQYGNIFQKGFVDMVNGGKDVWDSFTTSLATTFKTTVADKLYESFAQPLVIKFVASMVGLTGNVVSGVANAAGSSSLMSGISAASGAKSIYGMGSSYFGGSTAATYGTTVGSQQTAMLAAQEAGMGSSSTFSTVTPYAYIGAAMMANSSLYDAGYKWQDKAAIADPGMGLTTNLLTGLGMSDKGASILTGNAIEQAIFSKVMGLFTGPQAAETMGAAQGNYDAKGKLLSSQAIDVGQTDKQIANATERANILAQSYYSMASSLGIKGVGATFGFNSNTGRDGQNENVDFRVKAGSASYSSGEIGRTDKEAITLASSRAVMTALQASEMPKYLSEIFDGFTASTATQMQIDDITKLAQSYAGLHAELQDLPFEYLRDMSYKAAAGLVAAAGTMENLGSLLGGYYEAFYTSEEKKAQLTKNTTAAFEKLGIVMPALDESARAWYRSEVDRLGAMDMSVAANASAYTSVLSLSGAMNTLAPSIDNTAKSATDATAALAKTNAGWQDKLALLTGAETDRSIALRDATDESTKAIMRQVYAQEDLKTAADLVTASAAAKLSSVTNGASESMATLSRAVNAQKATEQAAYEANKAIATAAFTSQSSLMQASIDSIGASLTAVSASVGKLQSLSNSLKSTLDGMRISGSESAYRADAQAQITAALATARSGGSLPLDGQLASALSTVSKPSEQLYGTFEEYAKDFYKTANDISALGDLTDLQLTADQVTQAILTGQSKSLVDQKALLRDGFDAQVSGLDAILSNAQLQLDAANGINTSVLSVAAALAGFSQAISALEAVRSTQGVATTPGVADSRAAVIKEYMTGLQANTALTDMQKAQTLASRASIEGVSESEIASAWGASKADTRAYFAAAGIPQFAAGGDHSGGLRIVGERGIEIEATGPSRIWNADQTRSMLQGGGGGNSNAELVAELRALRQEVRELKASNKAISDNTKKLATQFDTATEGGRAMQQEAYT